MTRNNSRKSSNKYKYENHSNPKKINSLEATQDGHRFKGWDQNYSGSKGRVTNLLWLPSRIRRLWNNQ